MLSGGRSDNELMAFKPRYDDMSLSNGGVLRNTTIGETDFVSVYEYHGSGYVHGWDLNLETQDGWIIQFIIDDENLFQGYNRNYQVIQNINVTPTSFPVATRQTVQFNPTRANNTLYRITINGTPYTYTSDANATDAEIGNGLANAINADPNVAVIATVVGGPASDVLLTSKFLGVAFTYSNTANIVANPGTANVPIEVYTVTIGSVPYTFTSDGTPTAAEVVSGLIAVINGTPSAPVIASGTTVLNLVGKVSGPWTYAVTANMTAANATPNPFQFDYDGLSMTELGADTLYDLDSYVTSAPEDYSCIGMHLGINGKILWGFGGIPLKFTHSVQIRCKRHVGLGTRKFNAGLIAITKET